MSHLDRSIWRSKERQNVTEVDLLRLWRFSRCGVRSIESFSFESTMHSLLTICFFIVFTVGHAVCSPPPGYDELYGYPVTIGGLIVEGPFSYEGGPSVWSPKTPSGAYGLLDAAGDFKANGGNCPSIPKDSPLIHLSPVKLTNGVTNCLVGCNTSTVTKTGVDPCHVGSIGPPLSNSVMSCYDVGPGFAGGWGVCGYNCSALVPGRDLTYCTDDDLKSGNCAIYCDSTTFPHASSYGRPTKEVAGIGVSFL